jgi:amino acid adenylation domain-containing protein
MKVLNFCINSSPSPVFLSIARYLIDAGHKIFILETFENQVSKWQKNFGYNLYAINDKLSNVFETTIDFTIGDRHSSLNNPNSFGSIAALDFDINISDDRKSVKIYAYQNKDKKQYYLLPFRELEMDWSLTTSQNLDIVIFELTELFIDLIVSILREDDTAFTRNLYQNSSSKSCKHYGLFYLNQYIASLASLQSFYESVLHDKDIFKLEDNMGVCMNNTTDSMKTLKFCCDKKNLDHNKLQILGLYLLSMLSGRLEKVYSLTFTVPSDKITSVHKFVDISLRDSFYSISEKLNNQLYNVYKNEFYCGEVELSREDTPKALIAFYNDKASIKVSYSLMSLSYIQQDNELVLKYDSNIYFFNDANEYIEKFFKRYPEFCSGKIDFEQLLKLSDNCAKKYLKDWNTTDSEYPKHKSINQIFEDQAIFSPHSVAVEYQHNKLTYKQLNENANQLANYLITAFGINKEKPILLCFERSIDFIIVVLSILKTGVPYVPIDPDTPIKRIQEIIHDTSGKIIITCNRFKPKFEEKGNVVVIDYISIKEKISLCAKTNPEIFTTSNDLAYIMYTSGSTGKPKGVTINHKAVIRFVKNTNYISIKPVDVVVFASNVAFDATTFEIWAPLLNGARLVVFDKYVLLSPDRLAKTLVAHSVTVLHLTAGLFEQFCATSPSIFSGLKYLLFGGDKVNFAAIINLFKYKQNLPEHIINCYGPTENTTWTTTFEVTADVIQKYHILPIGKPISNSFVFILDKNMNPVPAGVVGEIYIGGEGLSPGYLGLDTLNKEKFISNNFITKFSLNPSWDKFYRTGDLGRFLPDGNIEFLGREDNQVKIRGYRVETTEIELVLCKNPKVSQAIVVPFTKVTGQKYLVMYVVPEREYNYTSKKEIINELIDYLLEKLPEYMIPSNFVILSDFPLNANGKVDIKALVKIEHNNQYNESYAAPISDTEQKLYKIWTEIINIADQKIDVNDDFFKLGGDSILAIKLTHRIRESFKESIDIKDIFHCKNIRKLASKIDELNFKDDDTNSLKEFEVKNNDLNSININKCRDVEVIFPANSLQQAFISHSINNIDSAEDPYHVQFVWCYNQKVDTEKLKESWFYAQQKFPPLRLRLSWDGEIIQVFDKIGKLDWRFVDLSAIRDDQKREARIAAMLNTDMLEKFDLRKGNLFRVHLIKESENSFRCIFSNHHAIFDGWGCAILLKFLHDTYLDLELGKQVSISEDMAYFNTQKYLQLCKKEKISFWKDYLSKIDIKADLNFLKLKSCKSDNTKNKICKNSFSCETIIITGDDYNKIKQICVTNGITINSVIQFIWHKALSVFCKIPKTIVGTVFSGRSLPVDGIEHSLGLYINTLPVIFDHYLDYDRTLIEAISNLQLEINKVASNCEVNVADLQEGDSHLFDNIFSYENYDYLTNRDQQSALKVNFIGGIQKPNYFDITVRAFENVNSINININFNSTLYDQQIFKSIMYFCKYLIIQIINNPCQKVRDISLTDNAQQIQLKEFQKYGYKVNKYYGQSLKSIFENQVQKTPSATALVFRNKIYNYKELNDVSNRLAHYIHNTGLVSRDHVVAICMKKSDELLITILALLKLGIPYVPIDPDYPDERIVFIVEDMKTETIFANNQNSNRLENLFNNDLKFLYPDDIELKKILDIQPRYNPTTNVLPSDIAYVIYTSGTTGLPKGVSAQHNACIQNITSFKREFFYSQEHLKTYSLSNFVFDIFIIEFGLPFISGGSIEIGDRDFQNLDCSKFDFIQITPGLCFAKLDNINNALNTTLFIGGEVLSSSLLRNTISKFKRVVNIYGTTETTIWSTFKVYHKKSRFDKITIGKAFDNEMLYILDDNLKQVPVNAVGYLYIGGIGVSKGYINREQLNVEKFIRNPYQIPEEQNKNLYFENGFNSRIYNSGDLARWLDNGEVELLGRDDFQIKIRGFRVEIGEIEQALSLHKDIKQAIITYNNTENENSSDHLKLLIAYFTTKTAKTLSEESIIEYLSTKLPHYMIPDLFVHLYQFPLNKSGKINRKLLPIPSSTLSSHTPCQGELEYALAKSFAEILNLPLEKINATDKFFKLGGNSILAIKLVSKIISTTGLSITTSDIFKYDSIRYLASYITHKDEDQQEYRIETYNMNEEEQVLSFSQERLLFIDQFTEQTNAYNLFFTLKLVPNINKTLLYQSILKIILRHEPLRTLIRKSSDGTFYQKIEDAFESMIKIDEIKFSCNEELEKEIEKKVNIAFDLQNELPIKFSFFEPLDNTKGKKYKYLLVLKHHIAFDGWSVDIFLKELYTIYQYLFDKANGNEALLDLPKLDFRFRDFAIWQRNYISGQKKTVQIEYWKNKLDSYEPLNLVSDFPRPKIFDYKGNEFSVQLSQSVSQNLRILSRQFEVSMFSLMLSAYCLMLSAFTGQKDIIIGVPISNRHYKNCENLIGFFVNNVVMRVKIDTTQTIYSFVKEVAKQVLETDTHQDIPFEQLLEVLKIKNDMSKNPIFQVMFSLQNFGNSILETNANMKNNFADIYHPSKNLHNISRFDLSTFIDDSFDSIKISFIYATSIFSSKTISSFIKTFKVILEQFANLAINNSGYRTQTITEINYINKEDQDKILYGINSTYSDFPSNTTIHKLFEAQVHKTPDYLALKYESQYLNYRDYNCLANVLAHKLVQKCNIHPGDFIIVFLDRSLHMPIALMGILKSGCAYVPIDVTSPEDRIKYIISDCSAKVILTDSKNECKIKDIYNDFIEGQKNNKKQNQKYQSIALIEKIDIEVLKKELISYEHYTRNLETNLSPTSCAYLIYTSGSTGKPKGVMIEHRSLVNRINWMNNKYPLTSNDKILQKTSYAFDVSVWEIFWANLYGASIVFAKSNGQKDVEYLNNVISDANITICHFVPSALKVYIDALENYKTNHGLKSLRVFLGNLKHIFCSGEALDLDDVLKINNLLPTVQIHNLYGPTETTIDSLYFDCEKYLDTVYIGKPIANTSVYILDDDLKLLPQYSVGEIYISGVGVARGYLNNEQLTKEKFVKNPFAKERNFFDSILYKTGDMGRFNENWDIEYLGRHDFQVKIRGFRVELQEIEKVLSNHYFIKNCLIIYENEKLIAYIVLNLNEGSVLLHREIHNTELEKVQDDQNHSKIYYDKQRNSYSEEEIVFIIKSYLKPILPDYMIPDYIVLINFLPLTQNGKIDKNSLPKIGVLNSSNTSHKIQNIQSKHDLCLICAEILKLDKSKVNFDDNFFDLGGNSILATKFMFRIEQIFNVKLTLKDVFLSKDLAEISSKIERSRRLCQ